MQAGEPEPELRTIDLFFALFSTGVKFYFPLFGVDFLPTMPPSEFSKREMLRV